MRIGVLTALLICLAGIYACKQDQASKPISYQKIEGKCMGTTYHITYASNVLASDMQQSVDSLLNAFEDDLSTYRPTSTISQFNSNAEGICIAKSSFFYKSLMGALPIYKSTDGAFDPTIGPLVNYWGFGYDHQKRKGEISNDTIAKLLKYVGFDKLEMSEKGDSLCLKKFDISQKLDLNASAKGHGVDEVANLLTKKGMTDYMVEIGGEVVAKGVNEKGKTWTLGINKPSSDASLSEIILPVTLQNQGMATSGNYRNFYKDGSLTFAHIINSKTGMSQPSDVLSATVIATDCLTADGYATAFMALGLDKSKVLVESIPGLEVCLIYQDTKADTLAFYKSAGFEKR